MKNQKEPKAQKPKITETEKDQIIERLDRISSLLEEMVKELTDTRKRVSPTSEEIFG